MVGVGKVLGFDLRVGEGLDSDGKEVGDVWYQDVN